MTVSPCAFGNSISDFIQDLVLDAADIEEFLNGLVHFSVDAFSDAGEVFCGVTLLRRFKAATVASSGARAQKTDEIQYGFCDGPCLRAARDQDIIVVPDMRDELRWPEYTPVILVEGIRSMVAVPFMLDEDTQAALNVYSEEPGRFDAAVVRMVQSHVRDVSKGFRLAVRLAHRADTVTQLKLALESRTVIDVAIGIIMGRSSCTQDEAVAVLKARSRRRNIKVRALAAQIVLARGGKNSTHFVV